MTTLSQPIIEQFRAGLRGDLSAPGDARYDTARAVWNGMIDRRPALIVRCEGVADVKHALARAREHGLPIAVRGGGHNIAGNAVCDGGVVIDLSSMRSVTVEPTLRRAYVEGGALLRDVDRETQAFGLATPLGVNSTTGAAGLILGGGFGWLSRKYGMSVDNLIAANVLTADGTMRKASATENPDLYWAIRGGGGNFGIVTLFELGLHAVGPTVLAGAVVFALEEARSVLEKYRDYIARAPDDVSLWAMLRKAPPLPFLPAHVVGTDVLVLLVFYAGDVTRGLQLVAPIPAFGHALGQHIGPIPYAAWQQNFDPMLTAGARNYWKSHNAMDLPDALIDTLIRFAGRLPHPECDILMGHLGGRTTRIAVESTAYPHRGTQLAINVHARWHAPKDDARCIGWAREFFAETARFGTGGTYVNFLTEDEQDRVPAAYGPNYARLAQVKRRFDPDNVFRQNQNIRPATEPTPASSRQAVDSVRSQRHP